jgi:hypothetical protein
VTGHGVDWALQSFIDCIVMRLLVAQTSIFRQPETLFSCIRAVQAFE